MLAVLGALVANGIITILKFIGAVVTGSSGIMAESLHSLADTTNQVFLLLGLRFYKRPASEKHPFGFGKNAFFGRSSPQFLFSESAQLTRFMKVCRNLFIRTNRQIFFGHIGFSEFLSFSKPRLSDLHFIRKSTKRITKVCHLDNT